MAFSIMIEHSKWLSEKEACEELIVDENFRVLERSWLFKARN